jgi:hypothetical protein
MEGDFASGCKVLSEYRKVQKELQELKKNSTYPSLDVMITEMLKHLQQYADEAAGTEVVQIATILNPRHRLNYIKKFNSNVEVQAESSLEYLFSTYSDRMPKRAPSVEIIATKPPDESDDEEDNLFPAGPAADTPQDYQLELKRYLEGAHPIGKGTSPLDWWAVSTASTFITADLFTLY